MKQGKSIFVWMIVLACPGFADEQARKIESHIEALRTADHEVQQKNLLLQGMDGSRNPKWMRGRKALVDLVMMGEKGWAAITGLTFCLEEGDAVRSMISLMPGPIHVEDGFDAKWSGFGEFEKRRHRELAVNETWAILYAQRDRRCSLDNQEEMLPSWYLVYKWHMTRCSKEFEDVRDALISLAYLRVHYRNDGKFPGHAHPWNGSVAEQRASLDRIREWCLLNLEEAPPEFHRDN